jgi:competence protein ComFB
MRHVRFEVPAVKVSNSLEEVVPGVVSRLIAADEHIRDCDACASDVLALTMTRLRPGYSSTAVGRVLSRIEAEKARGNTEITVAVLRAIAIVSANPHHDAAHS